VSFIIFTMTQSLKTRILVRNTASWRLTRFSDELFIAKNGFGTKKTFRSPDEVNSFEDYLVKQGYALRETGRSLTTIKRDAVPA